MSERFKVGDHVTWNSEAEHVSGTIIKVVDGPQVVIGNLG